MIYNNTLPLMDIYGDSIKEYKNLIISYPGHKTLLKNKLAAIYDKGFLDDAIKYCIRFLEKIGIKDYAIVDLWETCGRYLGKTSINCLHILKKNENKNMIYYFGEDDKFRRVLYREIVDTLLLSELSNKKKFVIFLSPRDEKKDASIDRRILYKFNVPSKTTRKAEIIVKKFIKNKLPFMMSKIYQPGNKLFDKLDNEFNKKDEK